MIPPSPSTASPAGAPIVEVAELTRAFGSRKAVAGVTFSLAPGDCLAVFGPNGAGKTTLLRLLSFCSFTLLYFAFVRSRYCYAVERDAAGPTADYDA